MPSRVIALLLAFVLLWSGLSTIEVPRMFATTSTEHQQTGGPEAGSDGSVEQHHLDGLPSQAHVDTASETPGLLQAPLEARTLSLLMARPRTLASTEAGPPFLAGPLRPPCSNAFAA
jgi:hypothetical protein